MSESPLQILCLLQSILTSRSVPCACPAWHSSLTKELSRLWLICSCCHHFERANSVRSLESSRHGRRLIADNLSVYRHRQVDLQVLSISSDLKPSSAIVIVVINLQTFAHLCQNADEKLFDAIVCDCGHVLHYLLPLNLKLFSTLQQCNLYGCEALICKKKPYL